MKYGVGSCDWVGVGGAPAMKRSCCLEGASEV